MTRIRCEQAVEPDKVSSRAWNEGRQTSHEVQRLEQNVGGAIAKRVLQFVDHQTIAVAAETLKANRGAGHIAAHSLQLPALLGLAEHCRIERITIARGREGLWWMRSLQSSSRGVQTQCLTSCNGAHRNPVANGRTLELCQCFLTTPIGVEVEPELIPVVIFLRDQRTTSHQRAGDAPNQRVENALEFGRRRPRGAMEARAVAVEGVGAVERDNGTPVAATPCPSRAPIASQALSSRFSIARRRRSAR